MIVVADTSPINYLILIGHIEILPRIYGKIIVPTAVWNELVDPDSPAKVREWIANAPAWIEQRSFAGEYDAKLALMDPGEREAIALAEELKADRLIADDLRARKAAMHRRIPVIGTLGVLRNAAQAGLLDFFESLTALQRTNFHFAPELLHKLLDEDSSEKTEG